MIALVIAPQGLNINKVASMVKRNEDLLEQLADYAEQTSEVEALALTGAARTAVCLAARREISPAHFRH